jgi:hypothetical protein
MRTSNFSRPDEVVRPGTASVRQHSLSDDFTPGEMDDLLEDGEQSGDSLDGDEVLAELRALRESAQG